MRVSALLVALACVAPAVAGPTDANPYAAELSAALADARKLDPLAAARTRYLSIRWQDSADADKWRKVLDLWTNGTSREAEFAYLRRVSPTLFALVVDNYGPQWADVWEQLANVDPHFHVQVQLQIGKPGKCYFGKTSSSAAGWYAVHVTRNVKVPALAPWLPPAEAAELVARCQTAVPIVRGDWWLSQAGIQFNRKGVGYADWLAVKDRNAFDALIAFDRKKSQAIKREVAAIVARSGVSNLPRQIFREQSLTGGRWETRDRITDNKDAGNALRQLDNDYVHEAEEIYGVLPNGLFVFFLSDAGGKRQDSAPDGIGFDATAPGRDGKIHLGVSCARCHLTGLQPIRDWARAVYSGGVSLNVADPDKYRRLAQIYLGELQEHLDDDTALYAKRLKRLTGWTTEQAAKAVGYCWAAYVERDYLPADLARELGCDEKVYLATLRAYYKANQLGDAVLASHIADPPLPIRVDDVEQLYPIVAPVILGGSR